MFRNSRPKRAPARQKPTQIAKPGKRSRESGAVKAELFDKLQSQFTRIRGTHALEILKKCNRDVQVIAIGGNQLTGKSTLCNNLLVKLEEEHYNVAVKHNKTPYNVTFLSAGQVFRQMAKMKGMEVAQLSKEAKKSPDIDINIEYESCKGIMGGIRYVGTNVGSIMNLELDEQGRCTKINTEQQDLIQPHEDDDSTDDSDEEFLQVNADTTGSTSMGTPQGGNSKQRHKLSKQFIPPTHPEHTIIIEGRNPAVMAAYCEYVLNKANITTVYLYCSPREQATRYISREIGSDLAQELTSLLPDTEYTSLTEAGEDLKQILTALKTNTYSSLPFAKPHVTVLEDLHEHIADVQMVVDKFIQNESRDADDMMRYRKNYDFPAELDYSSPHLYDHIIDTSDVFAEDTLGAVYSVLPPKIKDLDAFYSNQKF